MTVHQIQRSILELNAIDARNPNVQMEECRAYYYQRILPALEQVFDEWVPEGMTLRIDRLEFSLGWVPLNRWESVIKEEMGQVLQMLLQEFKRQQNGTQQTLSLTAHTSKGLEVKATVSWDTARRMEAIFHYLHTGMLPWWVGENIDLEALLEKALVEQPLPIVGLIQSPKPAVHKRLKSLLGAKQLTALSERLYPSGYASLEEGLSQLQRVWNLSSQYDFPLLSAADCAAVLEESLWTLLASGTTEVLNTRRQAFVALLTTVLRLRKWPGSGWSAFMKALQKADTVLGKAEARDLYEALQSILKQAEHTSFNDSPSKESELLTKGKAASQETLGIPVETLKTDLEEGLYVNTAGLVLLSPFFNRLFELSGLLQDGQFIDEAAKERGVHLLHYTAMAVPPSNEHDLVLPKLLCGIPLDSVVPLEDPLKEDQKQEAENMIAAAIEHWQALGQSSSAALRESFLQREGKLALVAGQYRLFINRQSLDILLERVPWNFHTIRHSWMPHMLFVDW
jgi:hypothetical protein